MDGAVPVSIRLRRSTPAHDAYTVRVYDRSFAALATARPADARRWVSTTRWLHGGLHLGGRLVVGLGVQWTPTRLPLHGAPPPPATLQLCVGHRCLLFHLARADAVPAALRRFLADPRVTFVGSGSANDRRMLWAHYGLHVARGSELRAAAGMGNASLEDMADRFLGYPGIHKPREVAMSAWHASRLSPDQVQYACVDAYLAFRLGLVLCPAAEPPALLHRAPPPAQHQQRAPVLVRQPPSARQHQQRAPVVFEWVRVDAAIRSSKVASLTESDMGSETDYDDDVGGTATHGLPIRAYASDSDDITDSSYGFEHVRFGASTDDEEDADDGYVTGSLAASDVDSNGDDQEDEEGCGEDDQEDEEACSEDDQEDEEGCSEDDQEDEEGCSEDDQEDEEGCNEDDQEDEEGCSEDDLEDEEGYEEYDVCDQDDEDEFCLL